MRPFGIPVAFLAAIGAAQVSAETLAETNARIFEDLRRIRGLNETQLALVKEIFRTSGYAGQGNPAVTLHPMSEPACEASAGGNAMEFYADAQFDQICGAPFMAPIYDPLSMAPEDAGSCIDRFEYPNIPCRYPVVWVRASEAAALCAAEGKRLCDAHEWEGACAGALEPPDYRFDLATGAPPKVAVERMRTAHNEVRAPDKAWSYGPAYKAGQCAAASAKSPTCLGGGWDTCGSNTYPSGSFPQCVSPLGVFDLNGNVAEHMNLPLAPQQMASSGSKALGVTEMKGSWFIWDDFRAHPDWCRWRAPYWHGSKVTSGKSHANYHLGFRCCKSI